MAKKKPLNPYKLTQGQLVEILNGTALGQVTTRATVSNWKAKSDFPMNPDGRTYRLDAVTAWLAKQRKERVGGEGDDDLVRLDREIKEATLRSAKAKAEEVEAKNELRKLEIKVDNGELLDAKGVERHRVERAAWIARVLDDLPGFAPRLQGLTLAQVRKELKTLSREMRTKMADGE